MIALLCSTGFVGWRQFFGESAVETRGDYDDPVPPRATTT
jgi:hypothetical protein